MSLARRLPARPTLLLALVSVLGAACGDSGGEPQDAGSAGGAGGAGGTGGAPSDGGATQDAGAVDTGVNPPRDAAGGTGRGRRRRRTRRCDPRIRSTRAPAIPAAAPTAPRATRVRRAMGARDKTRARDKTVRLARTAARIPGRAPTAGPAPMAGPSTDSGSSTDGSRPGWTLVWSDEFNAASGTGADTTKWNLVNKGDGFGNNELQFYTNRPENASPRRKRLSRHQSRQRNATWGANTHPRDSKARANSSRRMAASRRGSRSRADRASGLPSGCSAEYISTLSSGPAAGRSTSWRTSARSRGFCTEPCTGRGTRVAICYRPSDHVPGRGEPGGRRASPLRCRVGEGRGALLRRRHSLSHDSPRRPDVPAGSAWVWTITRFSSCS